MIITAAIAIVCMFITAGLCFAAIRRRQTGMSYVLFWQNPLSAQGQDFLQHGFFRGRFAEISRILFFGLATLIATAATIDGLS